jgi:hypothetical protein
MLPAFTISDLTKADVIWLARDARVPLDRALRILIEIYRLQQANEIDFWDLEAILHLRSACEATEVAVSELREGLGLLAGLQERGLTLDDIRTTLKVADDLGAAGLYLEEAVAVADLMKALEEAGVDPTMLEQLQAALARYEVLGYSSEQITPLAELSECIENLGITRGEVADLVAQIRRLRSLGLDAQAAEALVTAVGLAGISEGQRADMLAEVVEKGVIHVSLTALRAEREALCREIHPLRDEHAQLQNGLATARDDLTRIREEEAAARERLGTLQTTAKEFENALTAAQALEAFLRELDPGDRLFSHVAKIAEIQQKHPGRLVALERILGDSVRNRIRQFLLHISAPSSQPTTAKLSAPDTGR